MLRKARRVSPVTTVYLTILRYSNYYPAEVDQIKVFTDKEKRQTFMTEANDKRIDEWHWTGWDAELE